MGPTKTGRIRRLTLGAGTARLWRSTVAAWCDRAADETGARGTGRCGSWLFCAHLDHGDRLTTSCLGHWFADLADRGGHGDVTLHRLGHRDASTTLRISSHVLPLTDAEAAATLDRLYS